jgi:hypothetical protein
MAVNTNTDTLSGFSLTIRDFPDFYTRILSLRFPISVAEVLELRDLIKHSADIYEEPLDAAHNRDFQESLENAIHSFGIENPHHSERLVRVLIMLRGMHYQHTVASRDAEQKIRQLKAENRKRRRNHLHAGTVSLAALAVSGALWLTVPEFGWFPKLAALVSAIMAYGYFRTLPRLDHEVEQLGGQLNELLRKRVDSLNWRTLIHKLSLLLGYKQIQGIEVFRHEQHENPQKNYLVH